MKRIYGAGWSHVVAMMLAFAVTGYALVQLGPQALWNSDTWWKSILVWFVGAAVLHDLVLYPLYSLADRALPSVTLRSRISVRNHIRVPALGAALTFLVFLPGILNTDDTAIVAATGSGREAYLQRWLVLVLAMVAVSAIVLVVRLARRRSPSVDSAEPNPSKHGENSKVGEA